MHIEFGSSVQCEKAFRTTKEQKQEIIKDF